MNPTKEALNSTSTREAKREIILTEDKKKLSTPLLAVIALMTTALVFGGIFAATAKQRGPGVSVKRARISETVDYTIKNVEMTDVKAEVKNGYVSIPLSVVKKNRLVAFWYDKKRIKDARGKEKPLPLLAMISPSGRLIAAVAVCEPCRSERFHTEPDGTLTCNVCNTKWDLETFEGLSGGCPDYPPHELQYKVKDGRILLDEDTLLNWAPRAV